MVEGASNLARTRDIASDRRHHHQVFLGCVAPAVPLHASSVLRSSRPTGRVLVPCDHWGIVPFDYIGDQSVVQHVDADRLWDPSAWSLGDKVRVHGLLSSSRGVVRGRVCEADLPRSRQCCRRGVWEVLCFVACDSCGRGVCCPLLDADAVPSSLMMIPADKHGIAPLLPGRAAQSFRSGGGAWPPYRRDDGHELF